MTAIASTVATTRPTRFVAQPVGGTGLLEPLWGSPATEACPAIWPPPYPRARRDSRGLLTDDLAHPAAPRFGFEPVLHSELYGETCPSWPC